MASSSRRNGSTPLSERFHATWCSQIDWKRSNANGSRRITRGVYRNCIILGKTARVRVCFAVQRFPRGKSMNRSSLLVLSTLLLLPSAVVAQNVQQTTPVIVTTGQAEVKRAPDRAWVSINAESRSKDPKEAQRLNAAAMGAVMEKLKGMNLGADAIRTTSYELHPEFDYANNRQTLRGYVARNAIEVRVDEIARIGDVLGAAVGSGATTVGGLRFDLRDRAGAEREALRLAVQDARSRAEAAASGAGVTIMQGLRVEEQRMNEPGPRPMMREMAVQNMAADAPPITPGSIEIRSMVTLTVVVR